MVYYRGRTKSHELWTEQSPEPATSSGLFSASASPDGRWLAAGETDGTVLVWRGEELSAVVNGALFGSIGLAVLPQDHDGADGAFGEVVVKGHLGLVQEDKQKIPVFAQALGDAKRQGQAVAVSRQ